VQDGLGKSLFGGKLSYGAVAAVTWAVAIPFHVEASAFADLPADAVHALERLVRIARLEQLPWRGNPVGLAWFGVAGDYLMAPFAIGASSLADLLARQALFHALLAPLGGLLGCLLGRPLLGLSWGLVLAVSPDLAALSRDYPVNYLTTHWAMAAWLCSVALGSPAISGPSRRLWTGMLLLAGALATVSHPLAVGAIPATLTVTLLWGSLYSDSQQDDGSGLWPWMPVLLALFVLLPYAFSNVPALQDMLAHGRGDQGMSHGAAWRSSLAALKVLPVQLADFPGGRGLLWFLLLGLLPLIRDHRGRAALLFAVGWALFSLLSLALAGYAASPWHIFPMVLPVLSSGLLGWALLLDPAGGRLRWLGSWVLALLLLAASLPAVFSSSHAAAGSPVQAFAALADELVAVAGQQPFSYLEATSRCGVDWYPSATLLDLELRGLQPSGSGSAPLIAVVEQVPALAEVILPGELRRLRLSNGMVLRLHRAEDVEAWTALLSAQCGLDRPENSRDVRLELGGSAGLGLQGSCLLAMPCPSYRQEPSP
tara:strand:- start:1111 stop:2730 length:1620 start_codon:yes stop_codon:yes gene_type:complete